MSQITKATTTTTKIIPKYIPPLKISPTSSQELSVVMNKRASENNISVGFLVVISIDLGK